MTIVVFFLTVVPVGWSGEERIELVVSIVAKQVRFAVTHSFNARSNPKSAGLKLDESADFVGAVDVTLKTLDPSVVRTKRSPAVVPP